MPRSRCQPPAPYSHRSVKSSQSPFSADILSTAHDARLSPVTGTHTGMYGRTCISLGSSVAIRRDGTLPAHEFGVGDEVRLTPSKGQSGGGQSSSIEVSRKDTHRDRGLEAELRRFPRSRAHYRRTPSSCTPPWYHVSVCPLAGQGVVCRVTLSRLDFLVGSSDDVDDDLLDAWSSPTASLRLDMLANEATHRKMMEALTRLERYRDGPALRLINLLFGNTSPSPPRQAAVLQSTISTDLNESQREAVAFGLETDDVALIHGPPGESATGRRIRRFCMYRE